jgi:hypothetical protein
MRKILKNRLALSTVVTTLIILVVAVLLAGVVTYFAINVVSTRVQQQNLTISLQHIWVDSAGTAEAGMLITNTGGRDVVLTAIQVRGIAATFSGGDANVYVAVDTGGTIPSSLSCLTSNELTTQADNPFGGTGSFGLSSGELILNSGVSIVVYILAPQGVTIRDVGTTIGITVFTAQAMYYQETNVQVAPVGTTVG